MKLSIIVPVFEVENTLQQCLESIYQQMDHDGELILVDDGSTDRSHEICDEWGAKDGRIRVIHQSNLGLSAARNAGIDIATGEYITFVDADDAIEEGTYTQLAKIIDAHPEYDILEYPVYRHHGHALETFISWGDHVYTDIRQYWCECHAYEHTYAWNKIYRRALFDQVRFPVGKVFEDVYTYPQLLDDAKIVATTSQGAYFYKDNPHGITANASGKELKMLLEAHLSIYNKFMDDRYYIHILNIQMDVYESTGERPLLPKRKLTNFTGMRGKEKIKARMLNIVGIKILCQLNKLTHKFVKHR